MQVSNSNMTINWTDYDKELLKRKDVIIFKQNMIEKEMNHSELPTDIHLVEYSQNGQAYTDAVRAVKMSDIFDVYYDKLKTLGGGVVTRIRSGFGNIKPKLYNPPKKQNKK